MSGEDDWQVSRSLYQVLLGGPRRAMIYIGSILDEKEKIQKKKELQKRMNRMENKFIYWLRKQEGIRWSFHTRDYHVGFVKELVAGSTKPECLRLYCYISNPLWHKKYRPTLEMNTDFPYANCWITHKFMWDDIENQQIMKGPLPGPGWDIGMVGLVIKAFSCPEPKHDVTIQQVIRGEKDPLDYCADCWNLICVRNSPPSSLQRLALKACGKPTREWVGCCNHRFLSPYRSPTDLLIVREAVPYEILYRMKN
uniref:Viral infectivity factor n=1 Tax=Feline immunodeficiency virus TaxID=11673 RepID=A0A810XP16_9RETR|nr:viral infectivity factor [Feline immunodeficiency virus]